MVRTEIVNMTPEMAEDLLEINTSNRKPRQRVIDHYVSTIKRGEWILTHQGVAVSNTNVLLDGQHRLLAIIKSGKSMPIMVTTGLPDKAFSAIDSGAPRTLSDLTKIERAHVDAMNFAFKITSPQQKATPDIIFELYNSDLGKAIKEVCPATKTRILSTAPAVVAASIMYMKHGERAKINYRNFVNSDFDKMYPVQKALLKKMALNGDVVNRGTISINGTTIANERYYTIHYALNPDNRMVSTRVTVSENYKLNARREIAEIVKKIIYI